MYGTRVAELLRKNGLSVELDVRTRSVTSNLQYAHRRFIPYVVVVGSKEKEANSIQMKHMDSGRESKDKTSIKRKPTPRKLF